MTTPPAPDHATLPFPLPEAARDSLEGLALGDGFGERWFKLFRPAQQAAAEIEARIMPAESSWHWTDDTAMALALVHVLAFYDAVHQDDLARSYAAALPPSTPSWKAADVLGSGQRITAADTVPFALWSAACHLDDLVGALWSTAAGLGDVDTTCAITGGVVAARTGLGAVPGDWLSRREPLPDWATGAPSRS